MTLTEPLRPATAAALRDVGLDPDDVVRIVRAALAEDLGPGAGHDGGGLDVTSVATIPADQSDVADVVARAAGVVAGLPVAAAVFDLACSRTVGFQSVCVRVHNGRWRSGEGAAMCWRQCPARRGRS